MLILDVFNPRKIIPILSVSYELIVGDFDSDSYEENERYVLSGCLDSFPLKNISVITPIISGAQSDCKTLNGTPVLLSDFYRHLV